MFTLLPFLFAELFIKLFIETSNELVIYLTPLLAVILIHNGIEHTLMFKSLNTVLLMLSRHPEKLHVQRVEATALFLRVCNDWIDLLRLVHRVY